MAPRRRLLRAATLMKKDRAPNAERLAWCDGSILVTNVPPELLSARQALVQYRAPFRIVVAFARIRASPMGVVLSERNNV